MAWLGETLRSHPELALYLAIALGHLIARLRIGPLRLNVIIGVLLLGNVSLAPWGSVVVHLTAG